MSSDDIEARVRALKPIFIRGMQRSGTTILHRTLKNQGLSGFEEGHLWEEVLLPLARMRDPAYCELIRGPGYALAGDNQHVLQQHLALAIGDFHRRLLGDGARWVDKSPGPRSIPALPLLLEIFPNARIVFVVRNGMSVVHSGSAMWESGNPRIFYDMCHGWAQTQLLWRRIRPLVEGRFVELGQEEMGSDPHGTALTLASRLGLEDRSDEIGSELGTVRANSSFPDMAAGDYAYDIDWSDEMRRHFETVCGEEMVAWGYPVRYDAPAHPRERSEPLPHGEAFSPTDLMAYYAWVCQAHQSMTETMEIAKLHTDLVAAQRRIEVLSDGRSPGDAAGEHGAQD